MTGDERLDPDEKFQNAEGRTRTCMQIFRFGWKEGAEIESVEEGYVVNGELYRRVKDGESNAP